MCMGPCTWVPCACVPCPSSGSKCWGMGAMCLRAQHCVRVSVRAMYVGAECVPACHGRTRRVWALCVCMQLLRMWMRALGVHVAAGPVHMWVLRGCMPCVSMLAVCLRVVRMSCACTGDVCVCASPVCMSCICAQSLYIWAPRALCMRILCVSCACESVMWCVRGFLLSPDGATYAVYEPVG